MSVYLCVECDQHYCTECEPGQDACPTCHLGPFCPECAADHDTDCPGVASCDFCGGDHDLAACPEAVIDPENDDEGEGATDAEV